MCACVSLCIQKSKGLWGGGTACALRPLVLLTRDCCVAMETPVERRFYESFSNPLFCPTTWDLFITHTTYKSFHGGEGVQSPVNWSKWNKSTEKQKKQFMQKDTESTQMQRGQGSTMHAKKIFVHSWGDRSKHGNDLLLLLSVSFSRPWALGNDESVNKCALLYLVSLLTWKMKCKNEMTKNIQTPLFSLFFSLHFNNLPKN